MSKMIKIVVLFVALTAAFSFSQEGVKRDSLETSHYFLKQTEKSCPNGSYVNSKGNTVCRPSSSNAGGATAICRDGTYSYSQNRRGTCSKHGGVTQWL